MKKKLTVILLFGLFNLLFNIQVFAHEAEHEKPQIASEAALLIDAKSGQALFDKNAEAKMYPASLTKIATAIYAIEHGDLKDIVTVSEKARAVDGTRVYLVPGEKVPLKKLIQGLLINSGNDAGIAIAEHLHGNIKNFAVEINDYLKNTIGVKNTNFVNPHGLFDPNHYTTAADMAKITQYAMENKIFREIFGTKKLEWNGQAWKTTIYNHNRLLREIPYEGVTGGKTGYVDESGFTLVTTAERENLSLIAVVLNANRQSLAYSDTTNLFDYGFENYKTSKIIKGTEFTSDTGAEYKTKKDLYFTQGIEESVEQTLLADGTLQINTEAGLLTSFELTPVKEKKDKAIMASTMEIEEENEKPNPIRPVVIFAAIAIVIGVFGPLLYRKYRNAKSETD